MLDCHPFEAAGLGLAPFRFKGVTENMWSPAPGVPAKPGGCCDYCMNGIRYEFWIESADKKRFKVGCDCVKRLASADNRLISEVEKAERRLKAEKRDEAKKRKDERNNAVFEMLETNVGGVRDALCEKPHPHFPGKSLLEYVLWLRAHAGLSGRTRAVWIINEHRKDK